jgi:integrase
MGYVYRPKLKSGKRCQIYWAKYYVDGLPKRESTGCHEREDARRILKQREGAAVSGAPILPRADKVRYEEVADDLRAYYRTTGRRNLTEAEKRLMHLGAFFSDARLVAITPPRITAYVERRQQHGAANGTINRELAILSRMLKLAYENDRLRRVPLIRKLKEAEPRSGFFELEQFEAVRRHLSEDLQAAIAVAYTYGWRMQSEVLALERRHLDLEAGTLRLDPGMTKNRKGRIVYLTPELKAILGAHVEHVKALERRLGRIIPWLFPHLPAPHVAARLVGSQRADFRKAWIAACRLAGVPGRLRHDFRRTAARNLIRRGVPERVAMTITGHLTRSVFDRYNIVSDGDLREAARRLSASEPG